MIHPSDTDELVVVQAFLQRYLEDRANGRIVSDREYVARYPGFEPVIERELAKLCEKDDAADQDHRAARYDRRGEVGRGGMGRVLRVWDDKLSRELAMKVMHRAHGSREQHRFLAEARIMGSLQHPGIVPIHDLDEDSDGRPCFTMPLVRGVSFGHVIDAIHGGSGRWTTSRGVEILLRVCETMQFAHGKGVVHRDLKPANVMVGEFGEVFVMDWGLARADTTDATEPPTPSALDDVAPHLTQPGEVVGTPAYMPPEQARGRVSVADPRIDVYAIGAMLYHLLAGTMPYVAKGETVSSLTVLERLAKDPPVALSAQRAEAPPELAAICDRAMAREPAQRYASAAEVAEDLRAFLESRVVRAYETGTLAEARKWVRRNRGLAMAGGATVAALIIGLIVSLFERERADANAAHANASFELAHRAIHDLLSGLAEEPLFAVPALTDVRKRLLERGLAFQLEFLKLRGDRDRAARQAMASAEAEVAWIHRELGDFDRARQAGESARTRIDALLQDGPRSARLVETRARITTDLGVVYDRTGQTEQAMHSYRVAQRDADELLRASPNDRTYLLFKARALTEVATCMSNRGEHERSLAPREAAIELLKKLAVSREKRTAGRLARALTNKGTTLAALQRWQQAEQCIREGVAQLQELIADAPPGETTGEWRDTLAHAHNALRACHARTGRPNLAQRHIRKAVAIMRKLQEEFPGVPAYRVRLAKYVMNLGLGLLVAQRFTDARKALTESLALHEQFSNDSPREASAKKSIATCRHLLCQALLKVGDHHECQRQAAILSGAPGQPPERAARYTSECIALAQWDDSLREEERRDLVARYTRQALALLRSAVAAGFDEPKALEHRAFRPLRRHPEYRSIYSQLRKGGKRR